MLEQLDCIPWAELDHAYGTAEDVPELLRQLLDSDPAVRSRALWALYGNVFHQGSRYPATASVIPFLIELCSHPDTPERGDLLILWMHLITGYFTVQERPCWGDGVTIYGEGVADKTCDKDDPYSKSLHDIYRESLKGFDLLIELLKAEDSRIRAGAAALMACLPTLSCKFVPFLVSQLLREPAGWVRAAIAFALGELGVAEPLRTILAEDNAPEAKCMAACELARIAPEESLVEPLLQFIAEPIKGYDGIPGAGGKSSGDAAYAISQLPSEFQWKAVPVICDRLRQTRSFDTMPLVSTLLATAFQVRDEPLTEVSDAQREILRCLIDCQEVWSIGNFYATFGSYGLAFNRAECAKLAGVKFVDDQSLQALNSGVGMSKMGFHDIARADIEKALAHDPFILERTPSPDECWFYYAKAFAETDAQRAQEAFQRAVAINPVWAQRVDPAWRLAEILQDA